MDKKDLEENEKKDGRGEDIIYETEPPDEDRPRFVKEAGTQQYEADKVYTYEDYLNWNTEEDGRIELIDGKIYFMAAPSEKHQKLLGRLSNRFGNYLHGKSCDYYFAPFDVRIDLDLGKDSAVQPDLVVVCDDEKLTEQGLDGSPDLVIEILSKSTARRDRVIKFNKYLDAGVKEYWIVDPNREDVVVNLLKSGRYVARTYVKGDVIKVSILDDLYINVTDLFEGYKGDEIEEIEAARKEERVRAEAEKADLLQQTEAEKIENARKMIKDNLSVETIEQYLGLSEEMIKQLL